MNNHPGASLKLATILVPVDFSDGSKKALQYAVEFAREFSARIILLHVVRRHSPADAEREQRLKAWANEFVPNKIPVLVETRHGAQAIEIVDAARKFQAGLMVISTHGRTGRAHALAGSLAENLVQLAPCPVLVIREHEYDFIATAHSEENARNPGAKTGPAADFIGVAI